ELAAELAPPTALPPMPPMPPIPATPQMPPLAQASRSAAVELPLSFAQERLWFLDQLEPESPLYNLTGALCLRGRLSVSALERGVAEIVRRHMALRTVFTASGGRPVQEIVEPRFDGLPVVDLVGV